MAFKVKPSPAAGSALEDFIALLGGCTPMIVAGIPPPRAGFVGNFQHSIFFALFFFSRDA
jgi:hypothetical protein